MGDPFRILYFYPYLNFDTGSPKAMAQFIDALDRNVFQPVYCAAGSGPLTEALAARDVEIVGGDALSVDLRRPLAAFAAIRRQAERLRAWRIDLLHSHCFAWNADLILAAWILRIPVILHVHNPIDINFSNMARFAARKVLFCSHAEAQNCGHFDRIAGKAEVLHNVIDIETMGQGHSIRRKLGLEDGNIAIGTVAQVIHRKGIDVFVETARILLRERPDLVFLVAGPTSASEQEFGRRIMAEAEKPELRGRVRCLGSRTDIPDYLASLDLFMLPTRAEPLGLVVLEAMAAGLPVVASKVGGIPEIVTSPELGMLVEAVTPDAFATAIRKVLSMPDRGRAMGTRGRLSLPGRFDLGTSRERLKQIYLNLLSS